jgi:predicted DNA-binding protein
MKHVQVALSGELHKRLKIVCAYEGTEISEIMRKLIEDYVEKAEKKIKK